MHETTTNQANTPQTLTLQLQAEVASENNSPSAQHAQHLTERLSAHTPKQLSEKTESSRRAWPTPLKQKQQQSQAQAQASEAEKETDIELQPQTTNEEKAHDHMPTHAETDPHTRTHAQSVESQSTQHRTPTRAEMQVSLPEYESTFADFDEIVMQFGYVSLFVVAFPLAPLAALLNNVMEARLDATSLLRFHRRPHPKSAQSIGSPIHLLGCFVHSTNYGH